MLLADKEILANILVRTLDDFFGMEPKEVGILIEGEPSVGGTSAGTGMTNEKTEGGDMVICGRGARQQYPAIKAFLDVVDISIIACNRFLRPYIKRIPFDCRRGFANVQIIFYDVGLPFGKMRGGGEGVSFFGKRVPQQSGVV